MAKTRTVYSTQDDGAGTLRDALRITASYTPEWRDADALENGDIIDFSDELEEGGVITILLSSSLALPNGKDVIVDGGATWTDNGELKTRVILDAQGTKDEPTYRCLNISYAQNYTLSGLTFKNGTSLSSTDGGGVYATSNDATKTQTFNYCVFKNCYSSRYGGGLSCVNSSNRILNYCFFDTCEGIGGGASFASNTGDAIQLNNCTFKTCNGASTGGAYIYNGGNVIFNTCTFTNCTTTSTASTVSSTISITQTSFLTLNNCVIASTSTQYSVIINSATATVIISGNTSIDKLKTFTNASITTSAFTVSGALTVDDLNLADNTTVTFSGVDAVLAVTSSATIGTTTFAASEGATGYAAFPANTDISAATFTGVKNCTYGAGIESASLSKTTVTWTATNLSTDILIEQQNGDSWTTLTTTGTGGSYSGTFGEGTTVRLFDGVAFWYASTQFPYWVVNSFAVTNNDWIVTPYAISTNGGGGTDPVTGDPLPSWTVNTADITPNFKGL